MTDAEYQEAKRRIVAYEQTRAKRVLYKKIQDTADTMIIKTSAGETLALTGAEPLAAVRDYVTAKLLELDAEAEKI